MGTFDGLLSGGLGQALRVKVYRHKQDLDFREPASVGDVQHLVVRASRHSWVEGYFGPPKSMVWFIRGDEALWALAHTLGAQADDRPVGYIKLVLVEQAARGSGLGRRLMERWIAEARKRGVGSIYLRPYSLRPQEGIQTNRLVKFYRTLGFSVVRSLCDKASEFCDAKTVMALRDA
jgi:GNAT superfamily N-acetyltransferase